MGIQVSDDPHFAERVDEHLAGWPTVIMLTSGVLAAIDPRQSHHAAAARELLRLQRRILSRFVLAELDYLIATNAGQMEEVRFLADVANGAYEMQQFTSAHFATKAAVDMCLRLAVISLTHGPR